MQYVKQRVILYVMMYVMQCVLTCNMVYIFHESFLLIVTHFCDLQFLIKIHFLQLRKKSGAKSFMRRGSGNLGSLMYSIFFIYRKVNKKSPDQYFEPRCIKNMYKEGFGEPRFPEQVACGNRTRVLSYPKRESYLQTKATIIHFFQLRKKSGGKIS